MENLKNKLRNGDLSAAIVLAREYAKQNKNKESCVCMLIAHRICPHLITKVDFERHIAIWGSIGGRAKKMCSEKAGDSVTVLLANKH